MENFEKYFNEDFDLTEAYDFKDIESKKAFNRIWKEKFNTLLAGKKVCYAVPGKMSTSKSYSLVEKVYVGAETGNLFIKSEKFKSINIADALFGNWLTKKPHFEAEDTELTDALINLINEYKDAFHKAALEANGISRAEEHAAEKLDTQVDTGKDIAKENKTEDIVEWVKKHITGLVFRLPTTEKAKDAPKSLGARLAKTQGDLEHRYPGITNSKHFELVAKNPEPVRTWYSWWGLAALTSFDEPFENFPAELKQMVITAKAKSKDKDREVSDAKPTDKTINNIYFAFAILDLLDDEYTLCDKAPSAAQIADSDDVFKQDFDSINAYGEKVNESLTEDKEEICCICGEPIEGYGNNPEPYKHEGRCCNACNMKFVIPARLAELNKPEE